jgi:hypothetical protein
MNRERFALASLNESITCGASDFFAGLELQKKNITKNLLRTDKQGFLRKKEQKILFLK